MNKDRDIRLVVWKQFPIGARVRIKKTFRRGQTGKVIERLDDRIDGMARYCVLFTDGVKWDCVRWELTRIIGPKR